MITLLAQLAVVVILVTAIVLMVLTIIGRVFLAWWFGD